MSEFTLTPIDEEEETQTGFTLTPIDNSPQMTLTDIDQTAPAAGSSVVSNPWDKIDGPITKEAILNNPEMMGIVRKSMKTRFGLTNRRKVLLDEAYDESMEDEELFEAWQNYQRSFSGGQSVTTAAEVAFHQSASDEDKQTVGQSYMLFDQMPNIYSKDSTWAETFDGTYDYIKAAVWDPTTVMGLGVGRAVGAVGTKATSVALRKLAVDAFTTSLQQGASRATARVAASKAVGVAVKSRIPEIAKKGAVLAAIDLPTAIGADLGYQYSMIQGDVQDEYYQTQTALAALGTMALPALVAGFQGIRSLGNMKGADKLGVQNYTKIHEELSGQMTPANIQKAVIKNADFTKLSDTLSKLSDDVKNNLPNYTAWADEVKAGGKVADAKLAGDIGNGDMDQIFWRTFISGSKKEGGPQGIISALQEAGVVYIPRHKDDNISNFIGDIIKNLPKKEADEIHDWLVKTVKPYNDKFTDSPFKDFTAKELGTYFKKRSSNLGRGLGDLSLMKKALTSKKPTKAGDLAEEMRDPTKAIPQKELLRYSQSVYKRLLTAHPGTTGRNIVGWSVTTAANSVSDVVEAALHGGAGVLEYAAKGQTDRFRMAKGSITGAMRRGYNVLNWIDSLESAESYFQIKPDVHKKMTQYIAGGVETGDNLTKVGLDPNNRVAALTERTTNGLQALAGVKMQDEITKSLSFISSLHQGIQKKYGMSYNEFMQQPDALVKMFSPEFKQLEAKALERTLREAYSKPYLSPPDGHKTMPRLVAQGIETLSHAPGIGFLIPFGQFLNNSTAFLGDYSGVNAMIHLMNKARNKPIDMTEQSTTELLAKGAVGITALNYLFVPEADKKIDQGLRWNQELNDDGSIVDRTYDFPLALFMMAGQILAHSRRGEVPSDLAEEALQLLGGQAVREFTNAGDGLAEVALGAMKLELDPSEAATEILNLTVGRVASGFTRPLDPINQATAMLTDSFDNPDRRQGIEWYNNSVRYLDQMFDITSSSEERERPTNDSAPQDMGRVLGGYLSSQTPSDTDRMLAAVGKSPWKAIRWNGPPELKNRLDGIVEPIINDYAAKALDKYDFFNETPTRKRLILENEVLGPAKKEAQAILDDSITVRDQAFKRLKTINGFSKRELQDAQKVLGIGDMKVDDLATMPGGLETLDLLIDALQEPENYLGLE